MQFIKGFRKFLSKSWWRISGTRSRCSDTPKTFPWKLESSGTILMFEFWVSNPSSKIWVFHSEFTSIIWSLDQTIWNANCARDPITSQKIYEVEGTQMLISTKKKLFFLGDITLLSDNIFWHDFLCTTTTHHETFIFEVFKLQNAWWWCLGRVTTDSKREMYTKSTLTGIWW